MLEVPPVDEVVVVPVSVMLEDDVSVIEDVVVPSVSVLPLWTVVCDDSSVSSVELKLV